ncbi:hypothetical protein QN375_15740 [Pseudomonas sp. MH9.2]|uniref:hypothetical protein n=1 Tax=unclassified Pseudomonas TaxID=196821 RepID=UPI002AC97CAE|nr:MULTISPECIES: hypothetical protein [unclassified Pseudomonas]MEB0005519.1 hypothetical protein [Pseudomonas sp. RTB2]MEB0019406.1 hypothetical protein [Pseudomonas sp. RTB3]MEB0027213.1 hypothetical protein [Pseudomonas sp. MH9.2]MEB0269346.1 hypothetical protein [Pseudomonas sp. 5B4]WPX69867.1 hypothetical protein RHM55_04605 [Pseudomonas sp. MH9.2]
MPLREGHVLITGIDRSVEQRIGDKKELRVAITMFQLTESRTVLNKVERFGREFCMPNITLLDYRHDRSNLYRRVDSGLCSVGRTQREGGYSGA